jgi:TorA maturation chaperone TorD
VSAQPLEPEDEARAALYGLIARMFYAPPDQAVLGFVLHFNAFESGEQPAAVAWRELAEACRKAFPVMLENEHTELFVGTGKAEVTPYLTHYVIERASDNPLVALRQQLKRWNIGRRETVGEPEDHVAGVCETMRFAIAVQRRDAAEQKSFFETFLYRGTRRFCDAVAASPKAVFYKRVALFAGAFLELEREAFDML